MKMVLPVNFLSSVTMFAIILQIGKNYCSGASAYGYVNNLLMNSNCGKM